MSRQRFPSYRCRGNYTILVLIFFTCGQGRGRQKREKKVQQTVTGKNTCKLTGLNKVLRVSVASLVLTKRSRATDALLRREVNLINSFVNAQEEEYVRWKVQVLKK